MLSVYRRLLLSLALVPIAASAQWTHPVEVSAFLQWTTFDHSLHIDDFFAHGIEVGIGLTPRVSVAGDISQIITNGPVTSEVRTVPLRLRASYLRPITARIAAVGSAGLVHNSYSASRSGSDNGFTGMLGLRLALYDNVTVRSDLVADYMPSPVNAADGVHHTTNTGWRNSISITLGGNASPRATSLSSPKE